MFSFSFAFSDYYSNDHLNSWFIYISHKFVLYLFMSKMVNKHN